MSVELENLKELKTSFQTQVVIFEGTKIVDISFVRGGVLDPLETLRVRCCSYREETSTISFRTIANCRLCPEEPSPFVRLER